MRFVRRASLVFSLVLMVAIVVGFVARRAELAGERDRALTSAAELGSSHLGSIIDVVETTALAGTDPTGAVDALAASDDQLAACVVDADIIACIEGRDVRDDAIDLRQAWADGTAAPTPGAVVAVYDGAITIEATGARVSVIARAPVEFAANADGVRLWAATDVPEDAPIGSFAVEAGIRQTAVPVTGSQQLYVVASGADAVAISGDEMAFYVIVFTLAAALLLLAGATIVAEHRNLLDRASLDQLTRLPNRAEFQRRGSELLAAAQRNDAQVCVLLFDLNGFKLVNDTYGHAAGDQMLQAVAHRLRNAVREGDVVARWGGDEFVVAMPGIDSEEMGTRRAHQLAESVGGRTRLDGVDEPLRVKASVGVALWPEHGSDLEALIDAADRAMYQAKRNGAVSQVAASPTDLLTVDQLRRHGVGSSG